MKFFFYLWCRAQSLSRDQFRGIWAVYKDRREALWFKRYFADSILYADLKVLMRVSPVFDFLSDEGVVYVLDRLNADTEIHHDRPAKRLGEFINSWTLNIALPYLNGHGADAYIVADDFPAIRSLFLRNLLALLLPQVDHKDKDVVWDTLLSYQLKPELCV